MNFKHLHEAPNLMTALSGPLHSLEAHLLKLYPEIEMWFRQQWRRYHPPFYASVDIRNAGFKVAPVDTNLFPGGFNNISRDFSPLAIQAIQAALDAVCPDAQRILILPENHTRNQHYLESVAALQSLLVQAGYDTRIGQLNSDRQGATRLQLKSGKTIALHPLQRQGNRLVSGDFDPCRILLNNDLSKEIPAILQGIEQTIMPPPGLGWNARLKSIHFECYRQLVQEFASMIDLDSWFFDPLFLNCGQIDFMANQGQLCLAEKSQELLTQIRKKYDQHQIDAKPYIVIKADSGTYGMGVMTLSSPSEIFNLNRKQRSRMSKTKDGNVIRQVMLQEGVPTFETWGQAVAEPVVYLMDRYIVGGFYRVHGKRSAKENLNAPGMYFEPLTFESSYRQNPGEAQQPNRFYMYSVIARLALLAAAREIAQVQAA